MKFELYYPQWKEKALTFSYDDGQIYDRRLVELFNRYQLKATFHLNSGMLGQEGYVTKEELASLYSGHEVACHGVEHRYPTHLTREQLLKEYYEDRLELEKQTGRLVRGCSYAFGEYSDTVVDTLRSVGIVYSRTVASTGSYCVPSDFMRWQPTCHHNDAFEKDLESFYNKPAYMKLPLLYIWGHSFEFERQQTWEKMEQLCRSLSGQEDVWYATNIEYFQYMTAAKQLVFRADGSCPENPYKIPIYAEIDGEKVIL